MKSTPKRDETVTRTCVVCGALFAPRQVRGHISSVRTCSRACSVRLRAHTRYGLALESAPDKGSQRECAQCHHVFVVTSVGQRFCSRRCAARFNQPGPSPRTCPHCHRTFIPKRSRQQYCSTLCQHGAALGHIRESARNTKETRESLRQLQLRRIAEGSHPFLTAKPARGTTTPQPARPVLPTTPAQQAALPTPPPPRPLATPSATPMPAPTPPPPPLPDLPDVPEADGEDVDETSVLDVAPDDAEAGTPLTLPILGAEARAEWRHAGELRASQADRALRYEAARTPEGRTVILAGQGSYLGVESGALVCHQGRTHGVVAETREMFYPALHSVRRILWVGAHGHLTGTMTLAAAAWCQREGIHLSVLDGAGTPLCDVMPRNYPHDAELRRRQWFVSSGVVIPPAPPIGALVRELVRRKVAGQYRTLLAHPELPGQAACVALFTDWQGWLNMENPPAWQHDVPYLIKLEGRLAFAYFRAWEGWPLQWSKPDTRRVPPHWLTVRSRVSPLAPQHNARRAVDPCNAVLNYAYACLASQCRQALLIEGFDTSGGFLHADKPGRDSLTYDLMELERGAVDDLLLTFLGKTTLHYGDFAREPNGSIMLHPQLTRLLLAECRVPQSRVDEHASWLKRILLAGITSDRRDDSLARDPDSAESM
jgi:CRISPR-associated endonuclease Cas1